jgi:hypothetical protein
MALVIEEESGTYRGQIHEHNGYYAGDFSAYPAFAPVPAPVCASVSMAPSQATVHTLHASPTMVTVRPQRYVA